MSPDGAAPAPAALVSVVTPVYNGERYLEECIQSVLNQTYSAWEYVIMDNVSTDQTAAIAQRFADSDARIRVVKAQQFVDIYTNHNRGLREIDPRSRYCKVLQADDCMYPGCLERMVAVADAHPSVGLVSALRSVSGSVEHRVPVGRDQTVRPGHEVVRQEMLGLGWATGSPSAVMMRADLVRQAPDFYDPTFWHGDTDAAYRVLMSSDFGFVHEVLTYTRLHAEAQSSFSERVGSILPRDARLVLRYGRGALRPAEYRRRVRRFLARYGYFLASQRVKPSRRGDREFYDFHRREIGYAIAEADHEPAMRILLTLYRLLFVERAQPRLNRR